MLLRTVELKNLAAIRHLDLACLVFNACNLPQHASSGCLLP